MTQDNFDIALGNAIRHRRVTLGLTQKQLGGGVGVSAQMITKYESGLSAVSSYQLCRIAAALKTTPANLLKDDKQPRLDKRTTAMIAFTEAYRALSPARQKIVCALVWALKSE